MGLTAATYCTAFIVKWWCSRMADAEHVGTGKSQLPGLPLGGLGAHLEPTSSSASKTIARD